MRWTPARFPSSQPRAGGNNPIKQGELPRSVPRTYVDLTMSADGSDVVSVMGHLQGIGEIHFVTGDHDLYFDWESTAEFESRAKAIHLALGGTGATYRVHTEASGSPDHLLVPWPPPLGEVPEENPAYAGGRRAKGSDRG